MTPAIKKLNHFLDRTENDTIFFSRREATAIAAHIAKADATFAKVKRFHNSMGKPLGNEEIEG